MCNISREIVLNVSGELGEVWMENVVTYISVFSLGFLAGTELNLVLPSQPNDHSPYVIHSIPSVSTVHI
jgi:hypothetical protein